MCEKITIKYTITDSDDIHDMLFDMSRVDGGRPLTLICLTSVLKFVHERSSLFRSSSSVNFWRIFGILQEVVKQSRQKRYYVYLICKITHGSPSCGISLLIFNLKYLKSFAALTPKMSSWTGEGITKWNTWFADHRTKYSLSLSRKTVLLAAIWPEINVDDCLINE